MNDSSQTATADTTEVSAAVDEAVTSDDTTAEDDGAGNSTEDHQGSRRGSVPREDLETEGEIAADYLETLLDIADLDGDLEVDIERDRAAVSIVDSEDGPVSRSLVGPGASVLDALQELTRLAVQAETGDRSRLMLDIARYRADRKASLSDLATATAREAKESGEQQSLDPMTAFERKVVHDAVLAAGLTSRSEGEEPHRYVVVVPA